MFFLMSSRISKLLLVTGGCDSDEDFAFKAGLTVELKGMAGWHVCGVTCSLSIITLIYYYGLLWDNII